MRHVTDPRSLKSCPEPGDRALMARPQPLNHPRAADTRRGQRARCRVGGWGTIHRGGALRSLPGGQLPRKPRTCSARRVRPRKATATVVHRVLATLCPFPPSPPPVIAERTKVRGSMAGSGNTPPGHRGRSDTARSSEPGLHAPSPGETPGLSLHPEGPAAWLRGAALGLGLRGMQTRALLRLLSRLLFPTVLRAPHLHGVQRVHDGVLQNPGHRSRCHVGGHRGAGR